MLQSIFILQAAPPQGSVSFQLILMGGIYDSPSIKKSKRTKAFYRKVI